MAKSPSEHSEVPPAPSGLLHLNAGEMAARFHAMDWAATPLGALADWPQSLRVAVGICLNSHFPMFVWWGESLINIYNAAYIPVLGTRHPAALGKPAREVWDDVWPAILPQVDAVMRHGDATWTERGELTMQRHGHAETASFTWSYSPIFDESGGVGGLFCACIEETPRLIAERERDQLLARLQSERARLGEAFSRSPAFLVILNGPDHQIEFANERYHHLVGRRDLVGRSLREALPEVVSQGFIRILDQVFRSGEPYVGRSVRVELRRSPDQGLEEAFLDFVYQPLNGFDDVVTGILAQGVDVTEQHRRAKRDQLMLALDESIRALVEPGSIAEVCARLLAEHLVADRCVFVTVQDDDDSVDIAGQYSRGVPGFPVDRRLSELGPAIQPLLRQEAPYVVDDIDSHDPAPDNLPVYRRAMVQSLIWVPILRDRRILAAMAVTQSTPRSWRPEEVELVRQVAHRCEAARERARVAHDLVESNARFRRLSDDAPVIIRLSGSDGTPEYFNKRWFEFTGQTPGQAAAHGWLDVIHPEEQARARHASGTGRYTGGSTTVEYRVRHRDGEYRWCVDTTTPRFGADGNFLGYIGSMVDITDRKRLEATLAAERQVLELLATGASQPDLLKEIALALELQSSDDMLCAVLVRDVAEGAHFVVDAAPTLRGAFLGRVTGQGSEEEAGAIDGIGDYAEDGPCWREIRRFAAAHGVQLAYGSRIVASAGHTLGIIAVFYAAARAVSIRDAELARLGSRLAGIVIDRYRLDRRLAESIRTEQEARSEAERAVRAKDEFLATLSHELRTPLNAILSWAAVLRKIGVASADVNQGIEVIERNALAQARIIDDLLDMSAIVNGRMRLALRAVDLTPIVAAAVETIRPTADAKRIGIQWIPDSQAAVVALGDPDRLQQVMWNLLSNAVRFTPAEGLIRVALRAVDSNVEIEVSDNGEGIDPAFLEFVFDRFRQSDGSTTRRHGGLGLGLSIVKQLVESHGGSVRVSSEGCGRGATFVVCLPLAASELPALVPG